MNFNIANNFNVNIIIDFLAILIMLESLNEEHKELDFTDVSQLLIIVTSQLAVSWVVFTFPAIPWKWINYFWSTF